MARHTNMDDCIRMIDKHPVLAYLSVDEFPCGIKEDFREAADDFGSDMSFLFDNIRDVAQDIGLMCWAFARCLIYPVYRLYLIIHIRHMKLDYIGKDKNETNGSEYDAASNDCNSKEE